MSNIDEIDWNNSKLAVLSVHPSAWCMDNGTGQWFVYVPEATGGEVERLASWCESYKDAWIAAAKHVALHNPSKRSTPGEKQEPESLTSFWHRTVAVQPDPTPTGPDSEYLSLTPAEARQMGLHPPDGVIEVRLYGGFQFENVQPQPGPVDDLGELERLATILEYDSRFSRVSEDWNLRLYKVESRPAVALRLIARVRAAERALQAEREKATIIVDEGPGMHGLIEDVE